MKSKLQFSTMAVFLASVPLMAVHAQSPSSTGTAADLDWMHVDRDVWRVLADEPEHHLSAARAAYVEGNLADAAANVRIASELLDQRQQTLEAAQEKLDAMAGRLSSEDVKSVEEIDQAIQGTLATLKADGVWFPTAVGVTAVSKSEPAFHMDKARREFTEQDYKAAAVDIRKAAVFLELNSDNRSEADERPAVRREAADLQSLADQVAKGAVKDVSRLDQAFREARDVLEKTA